MKQIFAIIVSIVCLSLSNVINAQNKTQDAVYLVPNPQTARWSYIETDNTGKQIATVYNSIEYFHGDAVNGSMKVRVEEVPVTAPKDTIKSFMFYRFKDGELMADTGAMLSADFFGDSIKESYPDLTEEQVMEVLEEIKSRFAKVSGEIRGIPRYPKTGKLPDYEFQFKFTIMNMKVIGEERRIVGTEKIQTKAGLYDCFIMEETISTKALMMKDTEKIKSWYAYGIGLVKEITYDKNGKLISTMILNEVNW
jgi:hypothetical protein